MIGCPPESVIDFTGMRTRLNPDELVKRVRAKAAEVRPIVYGDKDPRNEDAHLALTFLDQLIQNAYRHLCADPEFVATLTPQLVRSLSEAIEDTRHEVHQVRSDVGQLKEQMGRLLKQTGNVRIHERLELQVAHLERQLRFDRDAVAKLLTVLLERRVPPDQWEIALKEAETKAQHLLEQVSRIPEDISDDILELKRQASHAANARDLFLAETLLRQIRDRRREVRDKIIVGIAAEEAEATADIAAALAARLDYGGAAELYQEAAEVPGLSVTLQWRWRERQAMMLRDLGRDFADVDALRQSIHLFRSSVLPLAPRDRRPDAWAQTTSNLADALRILGERTGETGYLEESVAMFPSALEIRSLERNPLEWAATMHGLATALATLGRREVGVARMREAVAAYRDVLAAWSRERSPSIGPRP